MFNVGERIRFKTKGGRAGVGKVLDVCKFSTANLKVQWSSPLGRHIEWFSVDEFSAVGRLP